ncbi:MAG: nitroreductase [Chthoniobacter sp.]|nr:nitroreductase [Chthoniobacter sp.]
MELFDAIYNRRAVRDYTDAVVPRATLMTLLNAAVQAPSAMNSQPWAFAVVTDRARLKDFSDRAKAHFLTLLTPDSPLFGHRDMLSDPATNIFYNAGTLVIFCAKQAGLEPGEDCSLAAQNLMLAAHASGLGTCPIGLARPWLNLPETKSELGIPADDQPVFPVIVGFPAGPTPAVARRDPEIVRWI